MSSTLSLIRTYYAYFYRIIGEHPENLGYTYIMFFLDVLDMYRLNYMIMYTRQTSKKIKNKKIFLFQSDITGPTARYR